MMDSIDNIINKRLGILNEFFIALAIVLAARASMILLMNYSADDYFQVNSENNYVLFVSQGRYLCCAIYSICEIFGAKFPFMGALWSILASSSYVFYGLVLRHLWMPNSSSLSGLSTVIIFALFPYHSDLLSYHAADPVIIASLCLGGLSLIFCDKGGWKTIISAFAMFFAISYQPFITIFIISIIIMAVIESSNFIKNKSSPELITAQLNKSIYRIYFFTIVIIINIVLSCGIQALSGISMQERGMLIALNDVPHQVVIFIKQLQYFFLRPEVSISISTKFFQLALIFLLFFGAIRGMLYSGKKSIQILKWCFLLTIFISLAGSATIAPYFILKNNTGCMSLRMIAGFSVFWSGIFCAAWIYNEGRVKNMVLCIGLILSISYAFKVNEQSYDFARINMRDHLIANRIVERLSLSPGYNNIRTVVFVGNNIMFNLADINTETSGFNVSSLYRSWSNTKVLSEISSLHLLLPTKEDIRDAVADAQGKPIWPDPRSTYIKNGIGIVVMGGR